MQNVHVMADKISEMEESEQSQKVPDVDCSIRVEDLVWDQEDKISLEDGEFKSL